MCAVVFIPLTQGKVAVIDFEDFEKVRPFNWCAEKRKNTWYARSRLKEKKFYMHRFILDVPPHLKTDHRDGDGLNNQRYNIRACSNTQNSRAFRTKRTGTASKFIGVWRDKTWSCWRAQISVGEKHFSLGGKGFQNEIDAARAYDIAATKYFGEFAALNFPKQSAED